MKLRAHFPRLQLLFVSVCIAGSTTHADLVIPKAGPRQEVKVLGISGNNLQVQMAAGIIGMPLSSIQEVQMAAPPEFLKAQQAFAAKDGAKALELIRALTDKFKGVPVEWAQQATGMLGDLFLANGDIARAENAYKEFQKLYPAAGSLQTEVGMARISIAKKDFAGAKDKLAPIAEAALKEKVIPRANAVAYSNAFLGLGQIKEHDGDLPGALESYLRTVTIFYQDPSAVLVAQERADDLRSRKISVP